MGPSSLKLLWDLNFMINNKRRNKHPRKMFVFALLLLFINFSISARIIFCIITRNDSLVHSESDHDGSLLRNHPQHLLQFFSHYFQILVK